eukprot:Skav226959  [mRNA]  locus=scaffold51:122035:141917:- [translate_table: standard]
MFSARFDGGPTERKFRGVYRILRRWLMQMLVTLDDCVLEEIDLMCNKSTQNDFVRLGSLGDRPGLLVHTRSLLASVEVSPSASGAAASVTTLAETRSNDVEFASGWDPGRDVERDLLRGMGLLLRLERGAGAKPRPLVSSKSTAVPMKPADLAKRVATLSASDELRVAPLNHALVKAAQLHGQCGELFELLPALSAAAEARQLEDLNDAALPKLYAQLGRAAVPGRVGGHPWPALGAMDGLGRLGAEECWVGGDDDQAGLHLPEGFAKISWGDWHLEGCDQVWH